jgi:hypothetical protein
MTIDTGRAYTLPEVGVILGRDISWVEAQADRMDASTDHNGTLLIPGLAVSLVAKHGLGEGMRFYWDTKKPYKD